MFSSQNTASQELSALLANTEYRDAMKILWLISVSQSTRVKVFFSMLTKLLTCCSNLKQKLN